MLRPIASMQTVFFFLFSLLFALLSAVDACTFFEHTNKACCHARVLLAFSVYTL